jgi:undecaprenyl-diphosphatase
VTVLQAVVLGIVQGITEFLPISSSAHLILVPWLFGWPDQGLSFDIAANTGTLLAVVVYFRHELRQLVGGFLRAAGKAPSEEDRRQARLAWGLVLGTLPAGAAGLALHDFVASEARNPRFVALEMIVFALVLLAADRLAKERRDLTALTVNDAVLIGCAQALALLPGTSRSGITMSAALLLGFARPAAARFSFLLSIPVGVLVAAKDGWSLLQGAPLAAGVVPMVTVVVVSALTGLAVIHWLLGWLRRRGMTVFVVYRLVLAVALLLALR